MTAPADYPAVAGPPGRFRRSYAGRGSPVLLRFGPPTSEVVGGGGQTAPKLSSSWAAWSTPT